LINSPAYIEKYFPQNKGVFAAGVISLLLGLLVSCQLYPSQKLSDNVLCNDEASIIKSPERLSETCLYFDIKKKVIAPQLIKFTPNYPLWSDGANKVRWFYLPENSQIDTSDPDSWIFPIGSQFFKEFRQTPHNSKTEIKVETRHFKKISTGHGIDSWRISSYLWNAEQTDAWLSLGAENVLNTDHDIPEPQDCIDCHKGNKDIILGFEALQLSDKQAKFAFGLGSQRKRNEWTIQRLNKQKLLTESLNMPTLPGSPVEQKMLGYLHANCGNCHNPLGHAADNDAEHLIFRHKLSFDRIEKTDVYRTAVNKKTKNFTAVPYIALGAAEEELALYQSALYLRMNSTDENYSMPMLAREKVDYMALSLVHQWLKTIPTAADASFIKDHRQQKNSITEEKQPAIITPLRGKGLQFDVQFFDKQNIPPVLALYWPEDNSLSNSPVMDHKNGYFTDKLILGNKGTTMSLRNSDEVGHTIYVKDKKQNVSWQLNYMPPESEFEQKLFWDNDVFVEMKCRLHLYMSAWVGSISSQYNQIYNLKLDNTYQKFSMTNYPEQFKQVKIWLPKIGVITTEIVSGQQQSFDLKLGEKLIGKLRISRNKL